MKNKFVLAPLATLTILLGASITTNLLDFNHPVSANHMIIAQSNNKTLLTGNFVNGEHPTTGIVKVITKNGKKYIELDSNFKTDKGPDLVVILHKKEDIIASSKAPGYPIQESDYVVIAPLKKFNGTQTYQIPNNVKLDNYKSVGIWCRKFNATFGAASLSKV